MMVAISLSCGRDDIQPATATARPLSSSSVALAGFLVEIKSKTGQWVLISYSGGDDVASKEEGAEEEDAEEVVQLYYNVAVLLR